MWSALVLAALAGTAWGTSDFVAGLWSRRLPVRTVLVWSKVAAMVLGVLAITFRATPMPHHGRLMLAVLAGLIGVPAMALFYRAMRDGSMALAAPVAAVAALVPVGWGIATGETFGRNATLGIAVALVGVTLVSWPVGQGRRPLVFRRGPTTYALGAAVGFGAFFVLLHESSVVDPYWSTAIARITSGIEVLILFGVQTTVVQIRAAQTRAAQTRLTQARVTQAGGVHRRSVHSRAVRAGPSPLEPVPRVTSLILLALVSVGCLDALADGAFAVASTVGPLATASVLASMYPAVTVLLSVCLLGERLHRLHLCGVLAALAGTAFLSAWSQT